MKFHRPISPTYSISLIGAVVGVALAGVPGSTYAQMRWEMRPVETITVTAQQFLTGDKNGRPVVVAGEMRGLSPASSCSEWPLRRWAE